MARGGASLLPELCPINLVIFGPVTVAILGQVSTEVDTCLRWRFETYGLGIATRWSRTSGDLLGLPRAESYFACLLQNGSFAPSSQPLSLARRDSRNLPSLILFGARAFIVRRDAVVRIGKPDHAVRRHNHVVGRIQPLPR